MTANRFWRFAGNAIAAIWIFGGAAVFFIRFSYVFYLDNQHAIDTALERFLGR